MFVVKTDKYGKYLQMKKTYPLKKYFWNSGHHLTSLPTSIKKALPTNIFPREFFSLDGSTLMGIVLNI